MCKAPADTKLYALRPLSAETPLTDPASAVPSVWSRLTETRPDRGRTEAASPTATHSLTHSASLMKYEDETQQVLVNTHLSLYWCPLVKRWPADAKEVD